MPDTIRPADRQHPERIAVVATITLDVELLLLPPNAVFPRIDTVVRYGDTVAVINGTPAATPVPLRVGPGMTPIAQVYVRPYDSGISQDQITNLQAEQPSGPRILGGTLRLGPGTADSVVKGTVQQRCCVCGSTEPSGRAFYENFRGQLFCWPCADGDRPCDCHQPPVRLSQHVDPAAKPSPKVRKAVTRAWLGLLAPWERG